MNQNSVRFDLSDWLIHFFRNINIESGSAPLIPEHMGFENVCEDVNYSALFMLRCAIRMRRLWATWSYRNEIRTIYGPNPAVCFTEMPLAAFLEISTQRAARGEAMSQFALVFSKKALYELGANPVIYGLDNRRFFAPSGVDGGARVLPEHILPLGEQYRYVTYNPSAPRPIDWTHEREWRWPYRGDLSFINSEIETCAVISDAKQIPGLEIGVSALRGMGVVVQTREQANWIAHDILVLVDRGDINPRHYSYILCASELPNDGSLREPGNVAQTMSASMIHLDQFFGVSPDEVNAANARFAQLAQSIESRYRSVEMGTPGGVWLWLLDNTHPLTRALLASGRISVSEGGRYLAHLREFNAGRSFVQRENMARELGAIISAEFGIEAGYFSVAGSQDFNEVPFYCDSHLTNRMFYNVSWK